MASSESAMENQRLQAELVALQAQLDALRSQLPQPPDRPHSPANSQPEIPPGRDPKLSEPPEFAGKPHEYISFVSLVTQYLEQKPRTFPNDRSHTAYFISRLRKEPADWATTLIAAESPILHDFPAFLAEFAAIYSDVDRVTNLQMKLENLKQTGSAREFSSRFSAICTGLGITKESTRKHLFIAKLKPSLRTALQYYAIQQTLSFSDLVGHAVRIDRAQYQERKAEGKEPHSISSRPRPSNLIRQGDSASQAKTNIPINTKKIISKPRGPLSEAEKQRRRDKGLCLYCGSPGHSLDNCTLKKAKEQQNIPSKQPVSSVIINSENSNPQSP